VVLPFDTALVQASTAELINIQGHQSVGNETQHLSQHMRVWRF
jgi:hypothetical protein